MRYIFATVLLAALCPSLAIARQRPDFSGTWTLAPDTQLDAKGKPAPAPGYGPQITIRQDASTFTVTRLIAGQQVFVKHSLDGSETRARMPGALCQADSQSLWTASWQDAAIVTTMTGSIAPGATVPSKRDVKATFRLQSPDTMSVALLLPTAAYPARTITTLYKKTGPPVAEPAPEPRVTTGSISALEWLGGTWVGGTAPNVSEERWTPPSGGSMLSVSRTLRNGSMTAFEFLCIVQRNGGLVYSAMPNGRQPATDFTMTKMEGSDVTFENPSHDFPKMIRYTLQPDGTLQAVVSGAAGQKPQVFTFRKQ